MKVETELEAFLFFISEDMMKLIVHCTNTFMKCQKKAEWEDLTLPELKAVLGLLLLSGVYRSQHESMDSLWSTNGFGRPIFPASMSRRRFKVRPLSGNLELLP